VPPFVSVHTFWASQVWSEIFEFLIIRNLPTYTKIFCTFYNHDCAKADLSKGHPNPKSKLGVTMPFSKIIELEFVKNMPYIQYILKLF